MISAADTHGSDRERISPQSEGFCVDDNGCSTMI